ncbi:MAG TPA: HD domain-containing protein [Candidatus Saccharimonadia bacterium]|nr:HD domain-containing protein [Candidatus Saccharimonadia bacterium]
MTQLEKLAEKVEELYTAQNPAADEWIDWAYPNHVLVVATLAEKIAKAQQANVEFAVAGALLHDIADAVMARENPDHEAESLRIATTLLQETCFSPEDTEFIIKEIITPHSCREISPTTLEGKVMATADGAAHFVTDFYPVFCWRHYGPEDNYQVFRDWVTKKIEKDFTKKLFFEDIKQEIRPRYEAVKLLFAN